MTANPYVSTPADRAVPLNVIGTKICVLASAQQTGGRQFTLQSGDEGSGPPPHSHDWDESFYITRGQVVFECAGETLTCGAGTLVHVPGGTVHAFRYGPGGGEMLEVTAGRSRAVEAFSALDREIPPGPPEVEKVVAVLADNGIKTHLPEE